MSLLKYYVLKMEQVVKSFSLLKEYCEKENFRGWDPYDGLNSKVFQKISLINKSAICRLVMIQAFKRSPINFRKIFLVPKEYNAKGIGLFLSGYCNLYNIVKKDPVKYKCFGTLEDIVHQINLLAKLLISLKTVGNFHGACWGYNFDWQARRIFLFPKNTPTVVATHFCASALISAFEITKNSEYIEVALSSADFIKKDLHFTPYNDGLIISYSPLKGNDTVFNASLLGAKLLSECFKYTKDESSIELASKSVKACCGAQNDDGSWVYGMLPVQSWIDSFHTGYNLIGLNAYEKYSGDNSYNENLRKGFEFYINNFFTSSGIPKYYNDRTFPIDIHCPGQLFVTLSDTGQFKQNEGLATKVIDWTINNMQDSKGFFYYQLKKGLSSRIPYMRWSNAFMFNALSCYIKEESNE